MPCFKGGSREMESLTSSEADKDFCFALSRTCVITNLVKIGFQFFRSRWWLLGTTSLPESEERYEPTSFRGTDCLFSHGYFLGHMGELDRSSPPSLVFDAKWVVKLQR